MRKWLLGLGACVLVIVSACIDVTNKAVAYAVIPGPAAAVGSTGGNQGACGTSLDFTPHGGSGYQVGQSVNLTLIAPATCQNPWWYVDHPEIALVQLNGPQGAILHFIAAGTVTLCVQPSETVTSPRHCETYTASGPTGNVTASPSAVNVSNCTGFVASYALAAMLNGTAVGATWTSSNPSVASVTSGGALTLIGTAGTATITGTTANGTVMIPVTVTQCNNGAVAVSPSNPSLNTGAGCSLTQQFTANVPVTWTFSGASSVGSISSSGLFTALSGQAGSFTVTATPASGSGYTASSVTIILNNVACSQQGRVDSVKVTPPTFGPLTVGAAPITLTATVYTTGSNIPTTVTWSTPNGNCVALTPNGNTVTVTPIAGCVGSVTVVATSTYDASKSGSSVGSTTSGNVTCQFTSSVGQQSPTGINLSVNQTATLTGSCTNQYGAQFTPYWYSDHPEFVLVTGSTTVVTIGGQTWPAGPQATIKGVAKGSATITMQAAITDTRALASQVVTVQ